MSHRIFIWMNMPSHHQSAFFDACSTWLGDDFKVAYYSVVGEDRKKLGWQAQPKMKHFETDVSHLQNAGEVLQAIPGWQNYIHIVPGFDGQLMQGVVIAFSKNKVPWLLWNETPGIRLFEQLNCNNALYRLFYLPVYKKSKKLFVEYVTRYSCGALMQGKMAREGFIKLGVDKKKMEDLYYTPAALTVTGKVKELDDFLKNDKAFICTAQLGKRKGIDLLIKAFAKLNAGGWKLVLIGKDTSNGLYKNMADKRGLTNKILFVNAIPFSEMGNYMNYADAFVLPTRFDGWGAVLNEAASLGKALISTTMCGAAWHLIEHGNNGYRVKVNSVKALQRAMANYVKDPTLVQLHGNYSRQLFRNGFTPEINVNRMLNAVDKLVYHR